MGVKPADIERAIQAGNRVLAQLHRLCPAPDPKSSEVLNPAPSKARRVKQRTKPKSNDLELEFGAHLRRLHENSSLGIWEQALTFLLANSVRYTPDWVMLCAETGLHCYEVKGKRMWDDAAVKIKVAASVYPNVHWMIVWKDDNGTWKTQALYP